MYDEPTDYPGQEQRPDEILGHGADRARAEGALGNDIDSLAWDAGTPHYYVVDWQL